MDSEWTEAMTGGEMMIGENRWFSVGGKFSGDEKSRKRFSLFSNFVFGMGSVMEIFPDRQVDPPERLERYSSSIEVQLRRDWEKLEGDLRNALGMPNHA